MIIANPLANHYSQRDEYMFPRLDSRQASVRGLVEDELLGSSPDAALGGSHERRPAIATGLTILNATDTR